MNMTRGFTEHPASVGETYTEHLFHAGCFGTRMVFAGFACLIHALLPFLFERTGSRAITELNERMVTRRRPGGSIVGEKRLSL
jgi:hypothetical protein